MTGSSSKLTLYLVSGNHESTHGIGEILYLIYHAFSGEFAIKRSNNIKKNEINIVIDEFSKRYFVHEVRSLRKLHPDTRIILIATEFITPVKLFGLKITETFNFFGGYRDWRNFCRGKLLQLVGRLPRY